MLAVIIVALTPVCAAGAGYVLGSQRGGPLLLSLDQPTPTDFRSTPSSVASMSKSDAVPVIDSADLNEPAIIATPDQSIRMFNGRPVRPVKTMRMKVTAYSPDERSCGPFADGITASGYSVSTNGGKLVAADTRLLPFGSLISVPGYDNGIVPVLDRGGAIKGHRLDVLYPTHERALKWGVQTLDITVWEYADGKPHGFKAIYNKSSSIQD